MESQTPVGWWLNFRRGLLRGMSILLTLATVWVALFFYVVSQAPSTTQECVNAFAANGNRVPPKYYAFLAFGWDNTIAGTCEHWSE